MEITQSMEKPIFLQIAEGIEDAILSGAFSEEEQIPSITEFSVKYTINPATALKGVNMLVDENIIYKKRGVGMFVKMGAAEQLRKKRRASFDNGYIKPVAEEAKRLGITKEDTLTMLENAFDA